MNRLSYEEILNRDGKYIFTPVGTSMLPMLRQRRDTVLVEKKNGAVKKHDVILYKRECGDYILHRVLKVKNGEYTLCGDNHTHLEKGVKDEQILGVMTAFWRDEKMIKTTDFSYRFYTKIWCFSLFLREFMLFFTRRLLK